MLIEIAGSGTSTQLFWVGEVSVLLPTLYYSYLTSQGPTRPGDSQAWAWQHDEFPKTPFSKWWANSTAVSLVNDGFLCLDFSPDIELRPTSPLFFLFFCKLFIQGRFRYMCPPGGIWFGKCIGEGEKAGPGTGLHEWSECYIVERASSCLGNVINIKILKMALDVPKVAGFQKLSSTVTLDQEVDIADGDVEFAALTRPLIVSCPDRHCLSIWTLTQLRFGLGLFQMIL